MNHTEEAEQHLRELLKDKQERIDHLEFELELRLMNISSLKELLCRNRAKSKYNAYHQELNN